MKKLEFKKLIREEIRSLLNEEEWVASNSDHWYQDEQLFNFVRSKLTKSHMGHKYKGIRVSEPLFVKFAEKVANMNNKTLHSKWKQNAKNYFWKKIEK